MTEIRIDEPGAGDWIMKQVEGYFTLGRDHSFSSHVDGEILGGIVVANYMGASATMHMAGGDAQWCSRDLLWMAFNYAFEQLGCRKLFGPVRADNYNALHINLRGGWSIETVLRDAYKDTHMVLLSMTKDQCPWLEYAPPAAANGKYWLPTWAKELLE
jgi:hypothetical protein